jgi:hypothetical protein
VYDHDHHVIADYDHRLATLSTANRKATRWRRWGWGIAGACVFLPAALGWMTIIPRSTPVPVDTPAALSDVDRGRGALWMHACREEIAPLAVPLALMQHPDFTPAQAEHAAEAYCAQVWRAYQQTHPVPTQ